MFNSCSKNYQKKFKKYLEMNIYFTYIALKLHNMKKTICLLAVIYLTFMAFMIPVMFFMFTDPTATNLFMASILSVCSGLGAYNYFLTFKSIKK